MQKQRGDPFVIFFKMYTKTPICILSDNDKTNIQSITNKTCDKIAEIRIIDFIRCVYVISVKKGSMVIAVYRISIFIQVTGHFIINHFQQLGRAKFHLWPKL